MENDVVTNSHNWNIGYIESNDLHCYVTCVCGESFSVSELVVECPTCHRKYWNEFRTFRMETWEQYIETAKIYYEMEHGK